jgi:hypothetical protein
MTMQPATEPQARPRAWSNGTGPPVSVETLEPLDPKDGRSERPFGMVTWQELEARAAAAPPAAIVEGHLAEGELGLLYGYAATFKSLLAIELALAVHRGVPFLGRFPTTRKRVGVIDEESPARRLGERLAAIARAHGIEPMDADLPLFAVGQHHRIDSGEAFVDVQELVLRNELEVLVVDALRRVHAGREDKADDMSVVMGGFSTLARNVERETGRPLSLLVVHHAPKPREGSSNSAELMARGSGDIFASADTALYVRRGKERGQIVVEHAKARWSEPLAPYLARVDADADTLRLAYGGNADETTGQHDRALELCRRELSSERALSRQELQTRAARAGLRQRTVDAALRELVKKGEASKGRHGRAAVYSATDQGLLG